MKAIILAAGRGRRMGNLTDDRPKCFAEVRGTRLLDWQLGALRGAGIHDIAIVRGYRAECFSEPVRYFENPRWNETNMVFSLRCANEWLSTDDCIVSYSDIFYSAGSVVHLINSSCAIAITYDPNWLSIWEKRFSNPLEDAETFRLNPDGTVLEIGNRPSTLEEIEGQYMGLLKFTPLGWSAVEQYLAAIPPTESERMDMTTLLAKLLARNTKITAVAIDDPWGEVDSEDDLKAYR